MYVACAAPTTPNAPERPGSAGPPAYAYPDDLPLVDRDSLKSLLVRLDSQHSIIWVFRETTESQAVTAALLAEQRDRLRDMRVEIVAVWAGPCRAWRESVVPMLHDVGANYPCAVISPPKFQEIAAWLTGSEAGQLETGLYLVDRYRHVLRRPQADAATDLAAILAELPQGGPRSHPSRR